MSREDSPYIVGDFWLDKRRDGKAPDIWQIARSEGRTVIYRSTKQRSLDDAKAVIDAHFANQKAKSRQQPSDEAMVAPLLHLYWVEHGSKVLRPQQIESSIRQFIAFMVQDDIGAMATVSDLTHNVFERFRVWRMSPHEYAIPWCGKVYRHKSAGVRGESVQRNLDDIRASLHHHENNQRITAPRIPSVPIQLRSEPRSTVLDYNQLGAMLGYANMLDDKGLFRFMAIMLATCVRSESAALFDPKQYNARTGLIDLHPEGRMRTYKRNAFVPAIDQLKPILAEWTNDARPVKSRKKAWRTMRAALELPENIVPTTIRHTVASLLRNDPKTPTELVDEFMGHVDLDATTKRYAKLDPKYLERIKPGLAKIWNRAMDESRRWSADHRLTIPKRGQKISVVKLSNKR